MRKLIAIAVVVFVGPLLAQEKESSAYVNNDLKLKFVGVYGWEKKTIAGSGAWTELASYTHIQFGAVVRLLARDNPYETSNQLRAAIANDFKGGASGTAFKDVSIKDAAMKGGLELPGFEVQAYETRVNDEGKKREYQVLERTYFGRNRLFRVECSAPRARAKRVRDLFETALAGLTVTADDERVSRGQPFHSQRGDYSCMIPEGFAAVLPSARSKTDMRFTSSSEGVTIAVYAYSYDGILADHVEELLDYYGDDIRMEQEEAAVLGSKGFVATRTKGESITLITGTVIDNRVYRIHTSALAKKIEGARRAHAAFQKNFAITGRRR